MIIYRIHLSRTASSFLSRDILLLDHNIPYTGQESAIKEEISVKISKKKCKNTTYLL